MSSTSNVVTSADETEISYVKSGTGPALVITHGSIASKEQWAPAIHELEKDFTCFVYDRRGRGDNLDATNYSIQNEIHPKHSYSPIRKHGLEVPETEIALDDSPSGPNEPFRIYRTRGPETDPTLGLPLLRTPWITARGDVTEYTGRERLLIDDGRSAMRRGQASAEWKG